MIDRLIAAVAIAGIVLAFLFHPIFDGAGMPPEGMYQENPHD